MLTVNIQGGGNLVPECARYFILASTDSTLSMILCALGGCLLWTIAADPLSSVFWLGLTNERYWPDIRGQKESGDGIFILSLPPFQVSTGWLHSSTKYLQLLSGSICSPQVLGAAVIGPRVSTFFC